jgi:ACS family hexuronate transporter-like MFS transporter
MIRRGVPIPKARKAGAAIFGVLMTAAIPAIFSSTPAQAIALISVATFGYTGYTANTLAFPAEVFPQGAVGSVWGLASTGSGFGGMIFASLSGWLIQLYGYVPVFIGYGILPLIGLSLVLFGLGPLVPASGFAREDGRGRP